MAEGGTATFTVTVTPGVATGDTLTIPWVPQGVGATAVDDFDPTGGSLIFTAGQSSKDIQVDTVQDTDVEIPEDFKVHLDTPTTQALAGYSKQDGTAWIISDDPYDISITDSADVAEGGTATFTVTVTPGVVTGDTLTIPWAPQGVGATADVDFDATGGSLILNEGESTMDIQVDTLPDSEVEVPEDFNVHLDTPATQAMAGFSKQDGKAWIISDDGYEISIANSADVAEGGTATFTVTINPAVAENDTLTIDWATVPDSALADIDYATDGGTLTFNTGDFTQDIQVTTIDDGDVEVPEIFKVHLSNVVTNAMAGIIVNDATARIISEDAYDISIADSADAVEGGSASFTVTINPAVVTGDTVTINFEAENDSAVEGDDFTLSPGSLTFAEGESTQDIVVPIENDDLVEFVETFYVKMTGVTTSAAATFTRDTGACNILIDDKYEISIDDITVPENVGSAEFTVTVTPAIQTDPGHTVTVQYATDDPATATADLDYTTTTGMLTFNALESSHTISVPITNDNLVEFQEIFVVNLSLATPAEITNIVDPQGECTIDIDEKYEIAVQDTSVGEGDGNAQFTLTVTPAIQAGDSVTIEYATEEGSALEPEDYTLTTGSLTFNNPDTFKTLNVPIINDRLVDPGEFFYLRISNSTPVAITTITDDLATCQIDDNNWYLNITKSGTGAGDLVIGTGTVSGLPGGTESPWPASIQYVFEDGDQVTLDVTPYSNPYPGSRFKEWTGDQTGSSASTIITMDNNKNVDGFITQLYYIATILSSRGSIDPPGVPVAPPLPDSDPTIAGHVIVEHGASQAFTITPAPIDWNVVKDVLVDGGSVGGSASPPVPVVGQNTYTFVNVTANHKFAATYDDHGGSCPSAFTLLDPVGNDPQIASVNGNINPGGDMDMFKFVTTSKGIVTIYTEGKTDTYGYLLNDSCATITENDEKSQDNSNFFIQLNLDPGTYYVRVRHWDAVNGTGAYRLYISFDPDDHGSNCNTATLVDRNSITAGELVAGDLDYFKFTMPAQGIVTTYTTGTTDTYGYFLDSNCNILTQDDNNKDANNFQIVREVGPGSYHVAVRHKNEVSGTGSYDLHVESNMTYVITATASYGGTIAPNGAVSVPEGGSQSFVIQGSGVNSIQKLEVDGVEEAGAVGQTSYSYNFSNVTSSHSIAVSFDLPQDACVDISDTPLDARYRAAPANIMFVMDDSGSMDWEFLTTDTDGMYRSHGDTNAYVFDDPGDNVYTRNYDILDRQEERLEWKTQWAGLNRIYYDPSVEYHPWPTLGDADPDTPRSHPYHTTPTFNLENVYDTVSTGSGGGFNPIVVDDGDSGFSKTPEPAAIVVNDRDPGFSRTATNGGSWSSDTDSMAYHNDYYYTRRNGDYTATWTPSLPSCVVINPGDCQYEVQAMWYEASNYSGSVDYVIHHAGGTDTVTVSQDSDNTADQWQGGKWNILGTYIFNGNPGENVQLIFTRTSTYARANADAVRFIPTGNGWDWATSGDDYLDRYYYTPEAGVNYTATWTPNLPVDGTYDVSVWYVDDTNRLTAVPYTINHAGGSDTVYRDQRAGGGQWVSLGTYTFNAGTGGNVTISYTVNDVDTERIVADAVKFTPPTIPATVRIYNSHYYVWSETANKPYLVNLGLNEIGYYALTDDGDDFIDTGELLPVMDPALVPADVKTGRTYAEERQNFANWYSFYRRRELTATAAISNVIVSMQGVNIGFASINNRLIQPVLPVNVGTTDQTQQLLNSLYGLVLQNNTTPLRKGLEDVGKYYHADDGQTGGIGASPYESADNGGECQQAFSIVMTDGYWNGNSPSVGNADKDEPGEPDNSIYDGPPYEDNYSNTLADVAMYYYETDLSPEGLTMDNGDPGLNDLVPTNIHDPATHQHMATYTVSFGVNGSLDPANYDLDSTDPADWPVWPDPTDSSNTKIDDLWHAAVNGRGTFTSAANPTELRDSLLAIMQNIQARIGSASSVSINGDELYDEVAADIRMFQASYNSDGWTGDVQAHAVDLETGTVETDSYLWSAAAQLESTAANDRIIATYDGSQGIPFRFDSPGLTDDLKDLLDTNWQTDDTFARNLLDYLRGDATHEEKNGGTLRNRIRKLGDIVHSSPTHNGGYLYTGGNDGMLHVFKVADGKEVFAYIPKLVFHNLTQLADPLYTHKYYVDLTPAVKGVNFSGTEKTILVGGLGKGGRGYYALDVTDPQDITSETVLANRVMWEYPNDSTPQSEIDDMGYSFSKAAIVNSKAGWVVIVGNGYNSTSGKAKLLVLDAATGDLVKSIDTGVADCNGLSAPVPIDVNYDDIVDYVYAGDLNGNMWKFDLTVPGPTDAGYDASHDPVTEPEYYWDVAFKDTPYTYTGTRKIGTTPMPLFQAKSLDGPQPITAKPDVMVHCDEAGYMVVFGTGKYLGESDITDTSTQSVYGIWDFGDDDDDSEYLGSFERADLHPLSNQQDYSVNLLQQEDVMCDPAVSTCAENNYLFTVGSVNLRVVTEYAPDWSTTSKLVDSSCGEGLGVEQCEPNGYGEHPDPVKNAGWYYDLPLIGERVVTDALLRDGKAIMIAYTPEQTPCGSGGNSIIMEMNACSGARLTTPQFDINDDGVIDSNDLINIGTEDNPIWVAPTGLQSEGRLYPPAILRIDEDKEKKYFSSSRGKIVEMMEKAAKLGMSYWIEYE